VKSRNGYLKANGTLLIKKGKAVLTATRLDIDSALENFTKMAT